MSKKTLHNPAVILTIILLVGFAVRLFMVLHSGDRLIWEDEVDYYQLATNLANGNGYVTAEGVPTAFRAPGYSVFLALPVLLGIGNVLVLKLLNVLLGTLTIWVVYVFSKRFMTDGGALIAAGVTSLYPYYVYMPSVLLVTTLFTLVLLLATWSLHRASHTKRPRDFLVTGILFTLAVLVRPSAMVLLLAAMFWAAWECKNVRCVLRNALIIGVTVLILIMPWMARNSLAVGSFSLTTNGYRNLWLGNNEQASMNSGSNIQLPAKLEKELAGLTEIEKEALYKKQAMTFITTHPGRFVVLTLKKGLAFWRPTPSPSTVTDTDTNRWSRLASMLFVIPVFLLTLAGLLWGQAPVRYNMMLWVLYGIAFTLLHAVFISKIRFRLPLDVYYIMIASMAVGDLAKTVKARVINYPQDRLGGGGV